ncbi:MAG: hypothetical protein HS111_08910 [Kofleriaceae bacterium]|nr:hypothetical protein [Kofleriaceae bacterium]
MTYGDLDGPSFDQLLAEGMAQGLTREQALERILGSATRTSEGTTGAAARREASHD